MKIIQVSRFCSVQEYNRVIPEDRHKTNQSILKFSRVLASGIVANGVESVAFSQRPVNRRNCPKKYLKSFEEVQEGTRFHYSRIFNLPIIGKFYLMLASFFWILFRKKEKDLYVLLDTYALALAVGTVAACKLRRIPCVGIVTDVPSVSTFTAESGKVSLKLRFNDWLISICDGLLLLTEQMNEVINPKGKPYVVIEGFADDSLGEKENKLEEKTAPRTVMYTGALDKKYGLGMLVEGFLKAEIPDCRLVIYGGGQYAKELEGIAAKEEHVVYGGTRPNDFIVAEQMRATLLVNPRFTEQSYTKYSFPGKNMEYVASGTPTLSTVLPGMPREYHDHVFLLEEETPQAMAEKLTEIMSLSSEELHRKGAAAKEWVLREKGAKKQVERLMDMMKNL